ncbi:acyl-CoA carboxylase subunit beta [Pleionea sp. CnH1-48]|uniref:acyl-CoA carboxylase subunit beta n=1 Tax=Pleionea sp. CnH1-48 TaxID=2954494 RepID=UPI00209738FC|nr:acyl-CoA carboxylase subunit beta [Pleionea sp. CnH1-48]MCO7227288.1 acyl-CoA carboxylase subunit beta [Pleionea sp. CnH1-48]
MPIIQSDIDTQASEFIANKEDMLNALNEVKDIEQRVIKKTESQREKFAKQKKLLPTERLSLLLDPGSSFLPLCSLAGYQMHDDKDGTLAGGNCFAGIGYVEGIRCLIKVDNSAIKGGTITPAGLQKSLRLLTIAKQNNLPIITLAESGGANLNYASEVFVEGARAFAEQARLSAAGIPQITVVHGNATAGGAYQPGLSDYVVMIKKKTKMFLAGPPLLKAATGELASDEELGGADMHAYTAGTAEYLAEDDADGIRYVKELIRKLNWPISPTEKQPIKLPHYDREELLGVVPVDNKRPYDVREIITRIADDSDFLDFKNEFDSQTVCGWISIEGHTLGVIGNNGPITANGANKAAQFIQLCDQTQRPLLFLHNTTGFMVGTHAEQNGIIRQGSKMLQAVANTRVPKISIVVGGSYGAGNYAMCGRGLDPHFIFSWPKSRTAVMGGAQAGKVLRIVTEAKERALGQEPNEQKLEQLEKMTAQGLDQQSTALYGTARLWDDGIIDPRDTREVLAQVLDTLHSAQQTQLAPNTFGIGR